MNSRTLKFKLRAAIIAALFFSNIQAQAIKSESKVETYNDVIEKAYNLSLQKDRVQAIAILVNSAKRESKKGEPPKEIVVALDEVSKVFYSDKAQQLFELAMSFRLSDLAASETKLSEAAKYEPENLLIQLEQVRIKIVQKECQKALDFALGLKEKNPISEEIDLVIYQASVCIGKVSTDEQKQKDLRKSPLRIFWLSAQSESLIKKNDLIAARALIGQMESLSASYPEINYWIWKLDPNKKEVSDKAANKYLTDCKKMTMRQRRDFIFEPNLCQHTIEVENYLKKNNNPK